jgi:hypothetical protein
MSRNRTVKPSPKKSLSSRDEPSFTTGISIFKTLIEKRHARRPRTYHKTAWLSPAGEINVFSICVENVRAICYTSDRRNDSLKFFEPLITHAAAETT